MSYYLQTRLKEEPETEERRKQSHGLVAENIKRELAESMSFLFGKYRTTEACRSFIAEQEKEGEDVDDTDGLDLAALFEAWRLRELGRIKERNYSES